MDTIEVFHGGESLGCDSGGGAVGRFIWPPISWSPSNLHFFNDDDSSPWGLGWTSDGFWLGAQLLTVGGWGGALIEGDPCILGA